MVKPQFEVGRERLGAGGVVRDASLRAEAVRTIAERASAIGLGTAGVTASPLPGSGRQRRVLPVAQRRSASARARGDRPGRPGRTAVTVRPYEPRAERAPPRAPGDAHRSRGGPGERPAGRATVPRCRPRGRAVRPGGRELAIPGTLTDDPDSPVTGCEIVVVLGGDGTMLRGAELARRAELPVVGHQPRPRRLPRRGRAGRPRRGRRPGHRASLRRRGTAHPRDPGDARRQRARCGAGRSTRPRSRRRRATR